MLTRRAAIVSDFLDVFGKVIVHAEGSTPSRTRLYQIGINKFLFDKTKFSTGVMV
jgi:hypothetical protein